jgi:hypothetical protein
MKYRDLNLRKVLARLKQAGQDLLGVLGLSNWSPGWETKIFSLNRQAPFSPSYSKQIAMFKQREKGMHIHIHAVGYNDLDLFSTKWSKWSLPGTRNRCKIEF